MQKNFIKKKYTKIKLTTNELFEKVSSNIFVPLI